MAQPSGVIVHVVAWEPRVEGGSGGFNWYRNPKLADRAYREFVNDPVSDEEHEHFRFDAQVSSYDAATEEIDAAWGEWAKFPNEPQPVDLR